MTMFKRNSGAGGFKGKKPFGAKPFGAKPFGAKPFGAKPGFKKPFTSGGYEAGERRSPGAGYGEERPSFEATCDTCGKECRVPFRPNGSKPVLCTNCFRRAGGPSGDKPSFASRPSYGASREPRSFPGAAAPRSAAGGDAKIEARLAAIEAKVNKILAALTGGDAEEATDEDEA